MKHFSKNKGMCVIIALVFFSCKQKAIPIISLAHPGRGCIETVQQPYRVVEGETDSQTIFIWIGDTTLKAGPIQIWFDFKNMSKGKSNYTFNESKKVITIDNETELIELNKTVGIKFFHSTVVEYGIIKHYIRYDILTLSGTEWQIIDSNGFSEILKSNCPTRVSVSIGKEGENDYLSYSCEYQLISN